MKIIKNLIISLLLISSLISYATDPLQPVRKSYPARKLTIEPGVGINRYLNTDILITNLLQWNIKKHFAVISRTSLSFNNAFARDFNYIKTNYNNTFSQTIGIGASVYTRHTSHTFSFMTGFKYDAFKETLDNPEFESVSVSVSSFSPDVAIMYNLKVGINKCFFSFRTYLPLYPYPFKAANIETIDANLSNISLEFGIGIRLK